MKKYDTIYLVHDDATIEKIMVLSIKPLTDYEFIVNDTYYFKRHSNNSTLRSISHNIFIDPNKAFKYATELLAKQIHKDRNKFVDAIIDSHNKYLEAVKFVKNL